MRPFRPYVVVALVLAAITYLYGGWPTLAGYALGLVASAFGLVAWWRMIRLLGSFQVSEEKAAGKLGTFLTILVFLVKFPLFGFLALAAARLDPRAAPCFFAGLALVYSAMVGWAVKQTADRQ